MKNANSNWLCIRVPNYGKRYSIVRPCCLRYEDAYNAIKNGTSIEIEACTIQAEDDETPEQFELRLAAEGIQLDFKLIDVEDDNFIKIKETQLVDLHTGEILIDYKSNE